MNSFDLCGLIVSAAMLIGVGLDAFRTLVRP